MSSMDLMGSFEYRETAGGMLATGGAGPRARDDQEAMPLQSHAAGLLMQASRLASRFLANQYAVLAMRWVLASVFIASACGKLVDIQRYSIGPVLEFNILPVPLAPIFGTVLPFVEALCGLGLLFGVMTRLSSLGILAMSTSFFIAKEILLLQGGDMVCGCFGAIVTTLASLTIYMDPPVMVMALAVMVSPRSSRRWVSLGSRLTEQSLKWVDPVW